MTADPPGAPVFVSNDQGIELDSLRLGKGEKALIHEACPNAIASVRVHPLDKGLSGAQTWLCQWPLPYGLESAAFVLKIGSPDKLRRELNAVDQFIVPVDPESGHIKLFGPNGDLALLRQAFIGLPGQEPISLNAWFKRNNTPLDPKTARSRIASIYTDRMRSWHSSDSAPSEMKTYREVFERRLDRIDDFEASLVSIGKEGLEKGFSEFNLGKVRDLMPKIESILAYKDAFPFGLSHGDLHAQNILVGPNDSFHLIDFAWAGFNWKAIDFIMLECSLKFLVGPADARLNDLLDMEEAIEEEDEEKISSLSRRVHGAMLEVIGSAILEIRDQAKRLHTYSNLDQYRRGLVVLMASLAGYPGLNRTFMFHSLAYYVSKL